MRKEGVKRVNYSIEEFEPEKTLLSIEIEEQSEEEKFSNNSYEELVLGPFL